MDKFKECTMLDFTSWDVCCKCVKISPEEKRRLKNIFKRRARRKLKQELCKEAQKIEC